MYTMRRLIFAVLCFCLLSHVLAQDSYIYPPNRSHHPNGFFRLHYICKRYGEYPVRDYYGRIRRCYYSYPHCPPGSYCRDDGYNYVCCRRRYPPYPPYPPYPFSRRNGYRNMPYGRSG